ncbi:MAG: PEPxxWA-CTERM sorting domain-containing protein [Thermaurantiacus tibetensis]|uniref:PEPxxWA-CTERM sorting domain-containing protein n=1 Tax=Thermaurantiacus tibetensis TaxID=2759035 RepID=UPI001F457568|nr:PEPxxWA-CTERM sorting domain-containing protein [Thermaurantiacus tibetensis]
MGKASGAVGWMLGAAIALAHPVEAGVHMITWTPSGSETLEVRIGGLAPGDPVDVTTSFVWQWASYWWEDRFEDGWVLWGNDYFGGDGFDLLPGQPVWRSLVLETSGYGSGVILGASLGAYLSRSADEALLTLRWRSRARDVCDSIPERRRVSFATCGATFWPGPEELWSQIDIMTGSSPSFVEVRTLPWTGPALPEPATWAMLVAGFGLVGGVLRRPRRRTAAVA